MFHQRFSVGLLLLGSLGFPFPLFGSEPAGLLPGTDLLRETRDWKRVTVDQIDAFLSRQTKIAGAERARFWQRDFSSPATYDRSVEPNRQRLRERIGAVDQR